MSLQQREIPDLGKPSDAEALSGDGTLIALTKSLRTLARPTTRYPYETIVTVAGTAVGSNTAFASTPNFVSVWVDRDAWIAETSAATGVAGDGTSGKRVFVAANERRVLPWSSTGFWVVNANTGETPKARVEGWA